MTTAALDIAAASGRPARRSGVMILGIGALALMLGFGLPWIVTSKLALSLMAQAMFDASLATSVGFLILQNGRVSFGQAAFFGLGGYMFGVLVARSLAAPQVALFLARV